MKSEIIKKAAFDLGFKCLIQEPMKNHTTFCIGGPADIFIEVNDNNKLPLLLKVVNETKEKLTVIGNGSNLLVSDKGIDGVVLSLCDDRISVVDNVIECSSGVKLSKLCNMALNASLEGVEFMWGIPGTVGGAVYMNAGAYGGEVSQVLSSCTSITKDGMIIERTAEEMNFGYRISDFKTNDEIILSAKFNLNKGNASDIKEKMQDLIARRKDKQPLEYASAGSTFKRPIGNYAGALIEQCGLKGYSIGDAAVSEKHAGFVINKGNATCDDCLKLIEHIKKIVFEKTGYSLETEVVFYSRD